MAGVQVLAPLKANGRALHSPTCIHGVYVDYMEFTGVYIDFRWSIGSPNMEFMLMAVYVDSM